MANAEDNHEVSFNQDFPLFCGLFHQTLCPELPCDHNTTMGAQPKIGTPGNPSLAFAIALGRKKS